MIGFIGSYTTFSTYALESYGLIEDGAWLAAGGNLLGSVALGMAAVIGGIADTDRSGGHQGKDPRHHPRDRRDAGRRLDDLERVEVITYRAGG